jgi:F-type H+-transporting ATPase subunit delta
MKLRPRVARRYARALHDLAVVNDALEDVIRDMERLRRGMAGSTELVAFISNYLLPHEARMRVLKALWAEALHPLTWRFIRLLESKRRLGILDDIGSEFIEFEEARRGLMRGSIASAYALTPQEVGDIADHLGRRLGKQVVLRADEERGLLGGYRLRVGDWVYDLSLAARLRLFRQTMMAGCGQGN